MRRLLALSLLAAAAPANTQPITLSPSFDAQFRYEQFAAERLLASDDAILIRARPGFELMTGPWLFAAESDAAVRLRRAGPGTVAEQAAARPDAVQLGELKIEYSGLAGTAISVGRQRLGLAGAAITGDRDGEQTFDAARLRWTGIPGISADLSYAWSSSSAWADDNGPLPVNAPGENIFAKLDWTSALGTLSGYAYQVDQRHARRGDFRLLNQVVGARFTGARRIGEDIRLGYSLGFVRQTGTLANAAAGSPTYWLVGSHLDLGDLTETSTSYRRFAAQGISTLNGSTMSVATTATRGRLSLGAAYSDFRPITDAGALPARDIRLSLGLTF